MYLEHGDLQILNKHEILQSRTDYVDHSAFLDKHRHSRLWLALLDSIKLPGSFRCILFTPHPSTVGSGIRSQQYNRLYLNFETTRLSIGGAKQSAPSPQAYRVALQSYFPLFPIGNIGSEILLTTFK